jgi:superfamily I DNA/RNA helicase
MSNVCKLNEISYNLKGSLICLSHKSHFSKCSLDHLYCKKAKRKMCEKGFVTQTDANYFAMALLEKYPEIAKSIAFRFPLFLIDEAQDTSEIQMRIFEILLENGLNRLMIIGDPNQAIYEWRTANPKVFLNKEKELETLLLNENWRSSEKICTFTDKLVSEDYISNALNEEVKNYHFEPEIWGYNNTTPLNVEINRLIKRFLELCEINNITINGENVAVLVRSNDVLNEIRNYGSFIEKDPWKEQKNQSIHYTLHCKNIARSKYLFDKKEYKESFKLLERTIYAIKKGEGYISTEELKLFINEIGFKKWRVEIFDLLTRLPKTDLKLKEWVDNANDVIKSDNFFGINYFEIKIKEKGDKRYSELRFEQMFRDQEVMSENYTVGTVHSVKGRTFEAVLLILKNKAYRNILYNDIRDDEEKRIIYVATTRPQKILVIALPVEDKNFWESKFFKSDNRMHKQSQLFDF